MGVQTNIIKLSSELLDRFAGELSRFEALQVAASMEHARLLEAAFVLQSANNGPGALEKVAMHMQETVAQLSDINDYMEDIASK